MRLHHIEVASFRNLQTARVDIGPRFNIFFGGNGQGKTNLLEAVGLLCELRSFRGVETEALISHGKETAQLSALAHSGGLDYEVKLTLGAGLRRLVVNGKPVVRQKNYLGTLPNVVFAPEDVRLAKGDPATRRRFLDRALFLVQPAHWDRSMEYKQMLKRRNRLLKEQRTADPLFEVYSERMAALGAEISFHRSLFAASLSAKMEEAARAVSAGSERFSLRYASHLDRDGEAFSDGGQRLAELLKQSLRRDRERGWTSVGPHVEDLAIDVDGHSASDYASQGQLRTAALAMKIAEIEVLHRMTGIFPALLVDDLSSELDLMRRERLLHYLSTTGGQVLLTSTEESLGAALEAEGLKRFKVEEGRVSPV